MLEYSENDIPHIQSPLSVSREELQLIFDRAIQTGRMVTCTLEELSWTPEWNPKITPMFEVKCGHFGLKIRGVTAEVQRKINYNWPIKGRLIDLEELYNELFKPWNMWLLNDVSFTSIGPYRYRELPTCDDPAASSKSYTWSSILNIRHRYGFEEVTPYIREGNRHLLGRWYRHYAGATWKLEWIEVSEMRLSTYSRMEENKDFHSVTYPLMDDDEFVSDFLSSTELYIPPNFVSVMTEKETVKQLRDALWWMECRFRLVPRFPKWMLEQLISQTILEKECFHLPMLNESMNTTQILQLYGQRGNPILLWLLTRTNQTRRNHECVK